jgi:hypothetical protein
MAWLDQTVTSHLPEKAGPALLSELQKQIRSSEFFVVGLLHSFSGWLLSGARVNSTFYFVLKFQPKNPSDRTQDLCDGDDHDAVHLERDHDRSV